MVLNLRPPSNYTVDRQRRTCSFVWWWVPISGARSSGEATLFAFNRLEPCWLGCFLWTKSSLIFLIISIFSSLPFFNTFEASRILQTFALDYLEFLRSAFVTEKCWSFGVKIYETLNWIQVLRMLFAADLVNWSHRHPHNAGRKAKQMFQTWVYYLSIIAIVVSGKWGQMGCRLFKNG